MTSRRPTVGRDTNGAIVVDASITAAWCLEDEVSPLTEAALEQVVRGGALVPAIWLVEMANVLVVAERRGRVEFRNGRTAYWGLCSPCPSWSMTTNRLRSGPPSSGSRGRRG